MKILIINHCFEQEISELELNKSNHHVFVFDIIKLKNLAKKIFPNDFFTKLSRINEPDFILQKEKYNKLAIKFYNQLYKKLKFDLIIAPSDTYFYLRPWVFHSKKLSIPFLILQKESTFSPYTMDNHPQEIFKHVPFISYKMFVANQRHKDFWLNSGVSYDLISITGNPRYDYYIKKNNPKLSDIGIEIEKNNKIILFPYYFATAYSPNSKEINWLKLRDETEKELINLLKNNESYVLLIKFHPQQIFDGDFYQKIQSKYGDLLKNRVKLINYKYDTRVLIENSDIVVGFQTTCLYEAILKGKKVIYTYWTKNVLSSSKYLLPFHKYNDYLFIAKSPEELNKLILSSNKIEASFLLRKKLFEENVSIVDGSSAERVFHFIENNFC